MFFDLLWIGCDWLYLYVLRILGQQFFRFEHFVFRHTLIGLSISTNATGTFLRCFLRISCDAFYNSSFVLFFMCNVFCCVWRWQLRGNRIDSGIAGRDSVTSVLQIYVNVPFFILCITSFSLSLFFLSLFIVFFGCSWCVMVTWLLWEQSMLNIFTIALHSKLTVRFKYGSTTVSTNKLSASRKSFFSIILHVNCYSLNFSVRNNEYWSMNLFWEDYRLVNTVLNGNIVKIRVWAEVSMLLSFGYWLLFLSFRLKSIFEFWRIVD